MATGRKVKVSRLEWSWHIASRLYITMRAGMAYSVIVTEITAESSLHTVWFSDSRRVEKVE